MPPARRPAVYQHDKGSAVGGSQAGWPVENRLRLRTVEARVLIDFWLHQAPLAGVFVEVGDPFGLALRRLQPHLGQLRLRLADICKQTGVCPRDSDERTDLQAVDCLEVPIDRHDGTPASKAGLEHGE